MISGVPRFQMSASEMMPVPVPVTGTVFPSHSDGSNLSCQVVTTDYSPSGTLVPLIS